MNLYHVTKFPPYFPFTLYCFYTKISSFIPVLTIGIVRDCFYLLIFYSEKFSTWVWSLPFAVNMNLNLSNLMSLRKTRDCSYPATAQLTRRIQIRFHELTKFLHVQGCWKWNENRPKQPLAFSTIPFSKHVFIQFLKVFSSKLISVSTAQQRVRWIRVTSYHFDISIRNCANESVNLQLDNIQCQLKKNNHWFVSQTQGWIKQLYMG